MKDLPHRSSASRNRLVKIAAVLCGAAVTFFGYRWYAWQQYDAQQEAQLAVSVKEDVAKYPLHAAIRSSDIAKAKQLLDEGADVNRKHHDSGNTPLHIAIDSADPLANVTLLFEYGADPNIANAQGDYPIASAIGIGTFVNPKPTEKERIALSLKLLKLFKQAGGSFNHRVSDLKSEDVNIKDGNLISAAFMDMCVTPPEEYNIPVELGYVDILTSN